MKYKLLGLLVCLAVILSIFGMGTAALGADPPGKTSPTGVDGGITSVPPSGLVPMKAQSMPSSALVAVDNGFGSIWQPNDPSPDNYPNGLYVWSGEFSSGSPNHAHAFFKFDVPAHPGYVNGLIKFGAYNDYRFGNADVSAVYYFADNSWSQATLTWNSVWNQAFQTSPGPIVDSVAIPEGGSDQYIEWNVTSAAASVWKNGGTITLVIARPNEGTGDYWRDFENLFYSASANPPYLTGEDTNGGARVWQLDSEVTPAGYEMEKNNTPGDDGQTGSVWVPSFGSHVWIADQAAMADVTFAADGAWKVEIATDTPWIDTEASGCNVLIGQWDGTMFTSFSSVFDMYSVTWDTTVGKYIFELKGQSGDETVANGNYLAIQISNTDSVGHTVYTGEGNYASCLTSPENDPGYPLPEMAAGMLAGLGLIGLAAFIVIKRKKTNSVLS
jgi:hypothetical protein